MDKITVFWFRRDLRLEDNCGLHHALRSGRYVLPVFIFDTTILERFEDKKDRRVDYIHQALRQLDARLTKQQSAMRTYVGTPQDVFRQLLGEYAVEAVFCNRDYEPDAIERDREVAGLLKAHNVQFHDFKDQVVFEKGDVLKPDGLPYTVYTPYANKWKSILRPDDYQEYRVDESRFLPQPEQEMHSLERIGFQKTDMVYHPPEPDAAVIDDYDKYRDFPALQHTTNLGIALRFGTISVRRCVQFALKHNAVWLNELVWREFFMQILYHFPKVVHSCFNENYERIAWRNNESEFRRWCKGKTGYPLVDAGMRQLNQTGQMHNRVRMIVASFLTKHLLIDWRWGEAYFARKLLDYDLAANNGNWQWAAGCGCDAAPYFRIFNPAEQTRKFDKDLEYVRKWNPEFEHDGFNPPIVEHAFARKRALETYKKALER